MNNTPKENSKKKKYDMPVYGICPLNILPHLNRIELVTYLVLTRYQGLEENCYPGIDIILKHTGLSNKSVSKAIFNLTKKGLLTVQRRYGKSSIYNVKYMVDNNIEQIQKDLKERNKLMRSKEKNRKPLEKANIEYEHRGNNHDEHRGGDDCEHRGGDEYEPCGNNYNINPSYKPTIKEKGWGEKQPIVNNHEDNETTDEPTAPTIPPEIQKDIDDNNRLLAEYKARQSMELEPTTPPQVIARVEDLLTTSNQFIQSIGFGFTRNPRHILDAIYKQLPEDYQIKEDPKDIELVKSAINQYDSSPPSERDALSKRFYGTVENMAKLYLIKKHGEEFRDKLYPEILNKNLIMYLNCNPTFKYCHGGFSNDIDGVYAEITRIVRKKAERREQEEQREEEKRIERERVRELMLNRPHYSDEEIHAMGLKTMSEILEASRNKGSQVELLDEKYKPVAPLSEKDRMREEELLKIMISGQRLNGEEQAEFDYLRRKKAMGIV